MSNLLAERVLVAYHARFDRRVLETSCALSRNRRLWAAAVAALALALAGTLWLRRDGATPQPAPPVPPSIAVLPFVYVIVSGHILMNAVALVVVFLGLLLIWSTHPLLGVVAGLIIGVVLIFAFPVFTARLLFRGRRRR